MPDILTTTVAAAKADAMTGYSVATAVWGILGSAVSMRFVTQMGLAKGATAIVSGGLTAMAATPIVGFIFGIVNEDVLYGVAFFMGLFGLSLTASVFDAIKNTKWTEILESWLRKKGSSGSDDAGA